VIIQASYVPCGCRALLAEKDPRAEIWLSVFGKLEFPLLHPIHHQGQGPGENSDLFLQGDWNALSQDQQFKLCDAMKTKFNVKESLFLSQIHALGYIPIKDRNITVVLCQLHSRMLM
jgi:hypothetical protein